VGEILPLISKTGKVGKKKYGTKRKEKASGVLEERVGKSYQT